MKRIPFAGRASVLFVVMLAIGMSSATAQTTTRVSVSSTGAQANNSSFNPVISANGRYVAFSSAATNLVSGTVGPSRSDIFVRDLVTGVTTRASVATDGTQANANSDGVAISADGRFVVFHSDATNLVSGDTNQQTDAFVRDLQTGVTSRVSVATDGSQGNGGSSAAAISADGRFVAFASTATNLVTQDTNNKRDVFVRDRITQRTDRVSINSDGSQSTLEASRPAISADGRFVAFEWGAFSWRIYMYDRQTGIVKDGSRPTCVCSGNGSSLEPAISPDGRFVAYGSSYSLLIAGDTNNAVDILVNDMQTDAKQRANVSNGGSQSAGDSVFWKPSISTLGRYVAFVSAANDLVTGDTNNSPDIFLHDFVTGGTSRVSVASAGSQANGNSFSPWLSADGNYVVFSSDASNLVPNDTNSAPDIFVRDLGSLPVDPLDHFDFSTISSPRTVGSSFNVTITARSSGGVRVFEDIEVSLSSTLGQVKPIRVSLLQGVATVALTLDAPGSGVVISAMGGGAIGRSNSFDVNGPAATGSLAGVVRTASGNPAAGATVLLNNASGGIQATSASDGSYSFPHQPCGAHTVKATTPDGRSTGTKNISIQCGGCITADLYLPTSACNILGLRPILLVPGILGSTRPVDSAYPRLPVQPPSSFDSEEWGTWSDSLLHPFSAGGLHDPFFKGGWRNLAEEIQSANPGYQVGCNLFPVPWDWRMPLDQAVQQYLRPAINSALAISGDVKVNVIAHSMGGLLTRAYLQSDTYRGDIDKFAMVGTPNLGSLYSYFMWQGGDPIAADEESAKAQGTWFDLLKFYTMTSERLFYDLLGRLPGDTSTISYSGDLAYIYHTRVKSMRQLLPTWLALLPNGALQCPPKGTIQWTNDWLSNLNNSPNRIRMVSENGDPAKIRTKIFAGNNYNVANYLNVESRQCLKSFYPDGTPISVQITTPGDGTVPLFSAYGGSGPGALGAQVSYTQEVTAKHSNLIEAYKCQLVQFMVDPSFSCSQSAAAPSKVGAATLTISVLGRPQPLLRGPDGGMSGINPLTGLRIATLAGSTVTMSADTGTVTVVGPSNGMYSVELISPYQEDYLLSVAYVDADRNDLVEVAGFYKAPMTITLAVDEVESPTIHIVHSPEPPRQLQADAVNSVGLVTQLSWAPVPDPQVVGYNIYGRLDVNPRLAQIGTSAGTTFNTGDPWAASPQQPVRAYAVSALYADGTESFLSSIVLNNDRDRDGITDAQEAVLGTSPDNRDSDADGLTDGQEVQRGTSPLIVDTDGDGYGDGQEVIVSTDPLDPASFGLFKDGFESGDLHRWTSHFP